MDYQERIGMLEDAGELIVEAIYAIRHAVAGTSIEARAQSYIIPHLESWIEGSNQQITIASMIAHFEEELGDYDDDDDYYREMRVE